VEPWLSKLEEGDSQTAWDLFVGRYRKLILATIRRLVSNGDDVMDVFATICQELSTNDFARLRRYSAARGEAVRLSTWLVVVVRNLTVDWLRHRDGRRRRVVPLHLTPLRQRIHLLMCAEAASTIEAFERLRSELPPPATFVAFLREVRETFREAPCAGSARTPMVPLESLDHEPGERPRDSLELEELTIHLRSALALESPEVRTAIDLVVVERLPAAEVARIVGWPNAKAVYNRVSRALLSARAELRRRGVQGPGDLQ
jgi:RNA polymerase sigma factor (sigma-70 family)